MQSRALRIAKEARLILWTWITVILIAVLSGVFKTLLPAVGRPNDIAVASATGFWLGIPLLAHVAFGEEFHQRTISLLLSQPIDRMKLWMDKWLVLTAAVCSAGFVNWLVWHQDVSTGVEWTASVWALVTVCTAAFWTLEARSTVGGLALNVIQIAVFVTVANLFYWLVGFSLLDAYIFDSVFAVGYGVLMFWLARRKFAVLEAKGDAGSADLLAGKGSFAALRCRRAGATLNLFRKELRFLSPVVLITIAGVLFLAGLLLFHDPTPAGWTRNDLALVLGLYSILPALLAGSLSMGEERTTGTHLWHLTLPVSTTRQWFIKLVTALVVSAVSVIVIAVIAFSWFSPGPSSDRRTLAVEVGNLLLFSGALTIAAFWCACIMKGTIRAVVAVLPACVAMFVGMRMSVLATMYLQTSSVLAYGLAIVHPYPWNNRTWEHVVFAGNRNSLLFPILYAAPVVGVALLQTAYLFRKDSSNSIRTFMRLLLLPVGVAVMVSFALQLPFALTGNSNYTTRTVLTETALAIQNMHIERGTLSDTSPRILTFEDVRRAAPLSGITKRWLADATISLTSRLLAYPVFDPKSRRLETRYFSYAVVHLTHQWECYIFPGNSASQYSFCKSPSGAWGPIPRE